MTGERDAPLLLVSPVRRVGRRWGFRGGLNDEWAVMNRGGGGAQVACCGEGATVELVYTDAVPARVDERGQLRFDREALGGIADHLEHGFLHSLADAFAYFGDTTEPSFTVAGGGVDVVGDEKFHQVTVHGM